MHLNQGSLPNPSKVFGIGLSRTGTKSLSLALHHLGINVAHFPDDDTTFQELSRAQYQFSILETIDGITDITAAHCYAQLDQLYPNSKFILTVRNRKAWLASLKKHWTAHPCFNDPKRNRPCDRTHMAVRQLLCAAVYGTYVFEAERAAYVYDQHIRQVSDYFINRPHQLLVLDICAGDSWTELCRFLNRPLPHTPFPYVRREIELDTFRATPRLQASPLVVA